MMTPWKLAVRRYRKNLSYQWRAIRTVIDWTVALYIVIPAVLLGTKFYLEWLETPVLPPILSQVSSIWLYPFLFPLFFARLRTWAEPGDILFLRQRPDWIHSLVCFGLLELGIRQLASFGVLMLLIMPLLRNSYDLSSMMLLRLFLWGISMSMLFALVKNAIHVQLAGMWRVLAGWLWNLVLLLAFRAMTAYIIMHPFVFGCALIAVILAVLLLSYWRVHVMYTYERDVDLELEIKMKLTAMLLKQAVDVKQRKRKGSKPLLFRRSGYLYKVKRPGQQVGAIGVKTLWRSSSHMIFYWQLLGVGLFAIVVSAAALPVLGYIVFPVLCIILGLWLNMYWRELVDSDVWNMFTFDGSVLSEAAFHFTSVNALLPGLLWGLSFGLILQSFLAALVYGLAGACAALFLARIIMTMIGYKRKEHAKPPASDATA